MKSRRKLLAGFLALVYFTTNCVLLHAAEINLVAMRSLSTNPHFTKLLQSVRTFIPVGAARVTAVRLPEGKTAGPIVIHIHDVHRNAEAQGNIAAVVRSLVEHQPVDVVGLEAAFGPVELSKFRSFRDASAVRRVADFLLRENRISGPVHVAMTVTAGFPSTVGVDDRSLYRRHVESVREAAMQRDAQLKAWASRRVKLNDEKAATFNSALWGFDSRVERYEQGELSMAEMIEFLAEDGVLPEQLRRFAAMSRVENALRTTNVQSEQTRLFAQLTAHLSVEQQQQLINSSRRLRAGEISSPDFYSNLAALCAQQNVSMSAFPSLNAYVRQINVTEKLNTTVLFQQLQQRIVAGYRLRVRSAHEQRLVNATYQSRTEKKLLDFSLSKQEWSAYKTLMANQFPARLSPFVRFYDLAEARDRAMADNMIRSMRSLPAANISIVVTGGFHGEGISHRLLREGMAVVDVAPVLKTVSDETGFETLRHFINAQTPLDQLLKSLDVTLSPEVVPVDLRPVAEAVARVAQQHDGPIPDGVRFASDLSSLGYPASAPTTQRKSARRWWQRLFSMIGLSGALLATQPSASGQQTSNFYAEAVQRVDEQLKIPNKYGAAVLNPTQLKRENDRRASIQARLGKITISTPLSDYLETLDQLREIKNPVFKNTYLAVVVESLAQRNALEDAAKAMVLMENNVPAGIVTRKDVETKLLPLLDAVDAPIRQQIEQQIQQARQQHTRWRSGDAQLLLLATGGVEIQPTMAHVKQLLNPYARARYVDEIVAELVKMESPVEAWRVFWTFSVRQAEQSDSTVYAMQFDSVRLHALMDREKNREAARWNYFYWYGLPSAFLILFFTFFGHRIQYMWQKRKMFRLIDSINSKDPGVSGRARSGLLEMIRIAKQPNVRRINRISTDDVVSLVHRIMDRPTYRGFQPDWMGDATLLNALLTAAEGENSLVSQSMRESDLFVIINALLRDTYPRQQWRSHPGRGAQTERLALQFATMISEPFARALEDYLDGDDVDKALKRMDTELAKLKWEAFTPVGSQKVLFIRQEQHPAFEMLVDPSWESEGMMGPSPVRWKDRDSHLSYFPEDPDYTHGYGVLLESFGLTSVSIGALFGVGLALLGTEKLQLVLQNPIMFGLVCVMVGAVSLLVGLLFAKSHRVVYKLKEKYFGVQYPKWSYVDARRQSLLMQGSSAAAAIVVGVFARSMSPLAVFGAMSAAFYVVNSVLHVLHNRGAADTDRKEIKERAVVAVGVLALLAAAVVTYASVFHLPFGPLLLYAQPTWFSAVRLSFIMTIASTFTELLVNLFLHPFDSHPPASSRMPISARLLISGATVLALRESLGFAVLLFAVFHTWGMAMPYLMREAIDNLDVDEPVPAPTEPPAAAAATDPLPDPASVESPAPKAFAELPVKEFTPRLAFARVFETETFEAVLASLDHDSQAKMVLMKEVADLVREQNAKVEGTDRAVVLNLLHSDLEQLQAILWRVSQQVMNEDRAERVAALDSLIAELAVNWFDTHLIKASESAGIEMDRTMFVISLAVTATIRNLNEIENDPREHEKILLQFMRMLGNEEYAARALEKVLADYSQPQKRYTAYYEAAKKKLGERQYVRAGIALMLFMIDLSRSKAALSTEVKAAFEKTALVVNRAAADIVDENNRRSHVLWQEDLSHVLEVLIMTERILTDQELRVAAHLGQVQIRENQEKEPRKVILVPSVELGTIGKSNTPTHFASSTGSHSGSKLFSLAVLALFVTEMRWAQNALMHWSVGALCVWAVVKLVQRFYRRGTERTTIGSLPEFKPQPWWEKNTRAAYYVTRRAA